MPRVISVEKGLQEAISLIQAGRLVAIPTETVYGLGANALDSRAVARIFEAKQRPQFDPLIVHIADFNQLYEVVASLHPLVDRLVETFWPGPLTLVLPKSNEVPSIVTSGLNTVAVRMPAHQVARELIAQAGLPVAAPSANSFGQLSPTSAAHVAEDLGDKVDLILDAGPCTYGIESTILDVSGDDVILLRHGAVAVEEIEKVVGSIQMRTSSTSNPTSPGQLESHYAPRTPLYLLSADDLSPENFKTTNAAYLAFNAAPDTASNYAHVEVLSPTGDLTIAAANLFEVLHALDRKDFSAIHVEQVPNQGLGRAINDRLQRAAAKKS